MPEVAAVRHRYRVGLLRTLAALTHNETVRATALALAEEFDRMAERTEDHGGSSASKTTRVEYGANQIINRATSI